MSSIFSFNSGMTLLFRNPRYGEGAKKMVRASVQRLLWTESCVGYMMMRDLRISDNWTLQAAQKEANKRSLPLVVFYPYCLDWLEAHGISSWQLNFMFHVLSLLKQELAPIGVSFVYLKVDNRLEMIEGVANFCRDTSIHHLFTTAEYEVDEKEVIRELDKVLHVHAIHQSCIVKPGTLTTLKGTQYAVFTPWYRSWCAHVNSHPNVLTTPTMNESPTDSSQNLNTTVKVESPTDNSLNSTITPTDAKSPSIGSQNLSDLGECPLKLTSEQQEYFDTHYKIESLDLPLQDFQDNVDLVLHYNTRRNDLTFSTSRMSHHLALGVVSPRQLIQIHLKRKDISKVDSGKADVVDYVRELAWRDFYRHILSNSPHVSKHLPYQLKYKSVPWENSGPAASHFEAWCNGETGFPIVDALMRQLLATGYLSNRSRMVVASFLAKNLLIDWRLGEQWFATHLIDYDFLSNNGGWGFCASVGVDPQPYFRVFNPLLQSTKFDKQAVFIKKWVPELAELDTKLSHLPYDTREGSRVAARERYPKPIVNYKKTREIAIQRYKESA